MIGKTLSSFRKRRGVTQAALALKMSVSRSRVKNIELSSNLSLMIIKRYFQACGYSLCIAVFDRDQKHLYSFDLSLVIDKLRDMRKTANLTQSELGVQMKVSRSRIEQIENGTSDVNIRTVYRYAMACGLLINLDVKALEE